MFRDYEQPIIPPDWKGPWRTFAQMVIRVFDELHMGIKSKDLDESLKKQIEEAGQHQEEDTGWVDLSSYKASNITPTTDYFMARRIGKVVHLRIACTIKTAISQNTWTAITSSIPDEFRPDYNMICVVHSQSSDPVRMRVGPGGTIQYYRRNNNIPVDAWGQVDVTYTVDGAPPASGS